MKRLEYPTVEKILAETSTATLKDGKLHCDMKEDCEKPVSMIDEKGYVYCAEHGNQRKGSMRCRNLSSSEKQQLESGKPLSKY